MSLETVNGDRISPETQLEIEAVLIRYSLGIDKKDWELLGRCFTEDCSAAFGELRYDSRADLVRTWDEIHTPLDGTLHRMMNFSVVAFDGDTATTCIYVDALLCRAGAEGGDFLQVSGYYDDELVLTEEGWQIASRRYYALHHQGNMGIFGDPSLTEQGYSDAAPAS